MTKITKPTLKWVGGKTKLKSLIADAAKIVINQNSEPFDYYEPFFGGGSIFFHLKDLSYIDNAYLNDTIPQLVSYYEVIADPKNLNSFYEQCKKIEKKFNSKSLQTTDKLSNIKRKIEFENLVKEFNSFWVNEKIVKNENGREAKEFLQIGPNNISQKIRSAVLMQSINKLCFNGMFRVNSNNKFNVPIGRYQKVDIINEENLKNVSSYLFKAKITCGTYKETIKNIKGRKNFIYLDPPYIPNSNTSNFTDYSSQGFKYEDHVELGNVFLELVKNKNNVVLSNNNNELSRKIFLQNKNLFAYEVLVSKSINRNKEGRGKTAELLISTFDLHDLVKKYKLKSIRFKNN